MRAPAIDIGHVEDEISLIDLATTLGKRKKVFLGLPFVFVLIAIVFSLVVTPKYTATATFMVPDKSSSSSQSILASIGGAAALGAVGGIKTPEELYVELLKSDSVRLYLANQFKLAEHYKTHTKDDLLKAINARVKVDTDKKSGIISVKVEDPSPQFAAELANAHLEAVRKLMNRIIENQEEMHLSFLQQQIDILERRPLKDPTIKTQLLLQLINNYESIRMTEAQNQIVLDPVDVAFPPERRSYPKRAMMVIIAGLAGLFLGALIAFIREALDKMSHDPESRSSIDLLKRAWWGSRRRA
ncbi:MAG TPA: Wzz/FepE/Etk N-terminal domain-containing protein [Ferrovaceae bacterium]|nr:Wzz/FepE/Etk N-terminal domain-containing protein [Ferrovaceae bacterium]